MAQRSVQYLNTAVIKALRVEASSVGGKRSFGGDAQKDDQCTDFQGGQRMGMENAFPILGHEISLKIQKKRRLRREWSNTRVPFTHLNLLIFPKVERKFSSTTFYRAAVLWDHQRL